MISSISFIADKIEYAILLTAMMNPLVNWYILYIILYMFWLQKYGKIDVIVSNAAVNPVNVPMLQTKESILDKLWETNVKASILLLQVKLSAHNRRSIMLTKYIP